MSLSSAVGEFAKKRQLAERGIFLEKGSAATSAGANAVSFKEPWNVAPTVFINSVPGFSGSANLVTTTGFNIQSSGTATFLWFAVRIPELGL